MFLDSHGSPKSDYLGTRGCNPNPHPGLQVAIRSCAGANAFPDYQTLTSFYSAWQHYQRCQKTYLRRCMSSRSARR